MSANDPLQTFDDHRIILKMRLRNYFVGDRFRLRSSLTTQAVAARINEAAGSSLWPLSIGVVGGVWAGQLRLRYRSSPFEYNAKPVLSGRLKDAPSGSNIEVRYRAPAWAYTFYVVWYLFLTFIAVGLVANGWAPGISNGDKTMAIAIFAVLLVAPVGLHALGTRHSDEELAELLDFLSQHAEAHR